LIIELAERFFFEGARGDIVKRDQPVIEGDMNPSKPLWQTGLPASVFVPDGEIPPQILAVGSGKGGVGKTTLSANLAAKLGLLGYRVLLVDVDIGGSNLHTHFGLDPYPHTLAHYLVYGQIPFEKLIQSTSIPSVYLISGGQEEIWAELDDLTPSLFLPLWENVLHAKTEFHIDFVIFDLGAGTQKHTIDFFSSAHMGILAVLPDPSSIENVYSLLKTVLWRFLDTTALALNAFHEATVIKEVLFHIHTPPRSYAQKLQELSAEYPIFISTLLEAMQSRTIGFVINQARSQADTMVGQNMSSIVQEYFGFQTQYLGALSYDESTWRSLRNRKLLVSAFPHALVSRKIGEIASRIIAPPLKGIQHESTPFR